MTHSRTYPREDFKLWGKVLTGATPGGVKIHNPVVLAGENQRLEGGWRQVHRRSRQRTDGARQKISVRHPKLQNKSPNPVRVSDPPQGPGSQRLGVTVPTVVAPAGTQSDNVGETEDSERRPTHRKLTVPPFSTSVCATDELASMPSPGKMECILLRFPACEEALSSIETSTCRFSAVLCC